MLCFFLFLMTVSSAPLALVHEKQAKNYVDLFQNKTLLSELAEADPGTLNTILGLLEGLLDDSEALSRQYTTDVDSALAAKNAASATLARAVINQTAAHGDQTAAEAVVAKTVVDVGTADQRVVDCTDIFDDADSHHQEKVDELNDKQEGVDAESATLRDTIALIQTLLPAAPATVRATELPAALVQDLCLGCSCNNWDASSQLYSTCRLITSSNKCNGYCIRCEQDGTTPMPGFYTKHNEACLAYSRSAQ